MLLLFDKFKLDNLFKDLFDFELIMLFSLSLETDDFIDLILFLKFNDLIIRLITGYYNFLTFACTQYR